MNANPRILEINSRVWIKRFGKNVNLSSVPDEQIDNWVHSGFDFIWLMGVWKINTDIISEYCFEPELVSSYNAALKDWHTKDVIGSPYSIDLYELNPILGSKEDLLRFKDRLNSRGIKLILDFVCNHFSAKSSLIWTNKELFLPADEFLFRNDPYTFYKSPANENEFLAHGRDPLFPPWKDTAQVNFYDHNARKFLTDTLIDLTTMCDGVRCDMAMLPLNNIFYNTWIGVIKKYGFERPKKEFWEETIPAVKQKRNDFIFIAETYWDLEWQLQNLGFDFTYDKRLTDRLASADVRSVRDHLRAEPNYQKKSVRFLENHDEDRAIIKFGKEKSLAAAVVISTIQGMIFYFDGQCEGKKIKLPLQLGREPVEKQDERIKIFYRKLFEITKSKVFRNGSWMLLEPLPVSSNDDTYDNILCWIWELKDEMKIIAVNYTNKTSRCRLKFDTKFVSDNVVLIDELNNVEYSRSKKEINEKGLYIELKSYNSHIFSVSDFKQ